MTDKIIIKKVNLNEFLKWILLTPYDRVVDRRDMWDKVELTLELKELILWK